MIAEASFEILRDTFGAVAGFDRPVKLVGRKGRSYLTRSGAWVADVELIRSDCAPFVSELLDGVDVGNVVADAYRVMGAEELQASHVGYYADTVAQSDFFDDRWEASVAAFLNRLG